MNELERLAQEACDEAAVTEVIRPAAIIPENAARAILMQLALLDVRVEGQWQADPSVWRRFDRPWNGADGGPGTGGGGGRIPVAFGRPTGEGNTVSRGALSGLGPARGRAGGQAPPEAPRSRDP